VQLTSSFWNSVPLNWWLLFEAGGLTFKVPNVDVRKHVTWRIVSAGVGGSVLSLQEEVDQYCVCRGRWISIVSAGAGGSVLCLQEQVDQYCVCRSKWISIVSAGAGGSVLCLQEQVDQYCLVLCHHARLIYSYSYWMQFLLMHEIR
jgi:hypothetical protein